jgi:hypothetical protein
MVRDGAEQWLGQVSRVEGQSEVRWAMGKDGRECVGLLPDPTARGKNSERQVGKAEPRCASTRPGRGGGQIQSVRKTCEDASREAAVRVGSIVHTYRQ